MLIEGYSASCTIPCYLFLSLTHQFVTTSAEGYEFEEQYIKISIDEIAL